MNKLLRPRHLALTALAAVMLAPLSQVHARDGRFHIPFLPDGVYTTDRINGNDARDSRDSTISRNDVPLDGRDGLPNSSAYRDSEYRDRSARYPTDSGVVTSQTPSSVPETSVQDSGADAVTAGRDSSTMRGDQMDAPAVGTGANTLDRDPNDSTGSVGTANGANGAEGRN